VLSPPEIVEIVGPVIFLAGPIQGSDDWQERAAETIGASGVELAIADPRRDYFEEAFDYNSQVDWETHYLRRAASDGCILFWLPTETVHDCGRSYAQTTRFELAEWKVRHEQGGVNLVVGIDRQFSGARYIRHRLAEDCPNIPICDSLAETCAAALGLLSAATKQTA
jgi:hypothetical protein